jgi:hypothetical protein
VQGDGGQEFYLVDPKKIKPVLFHLSKRVVLWNGPIAGMELDNKIKNRERISMSLEFG